MVKIASQKSGDRITFKDFVDFFYKVDWKHSACPRQLKYIFFPPLRLISLSSQLKADITLLIFYKNGR